MKSFAVALSLIASVFQPMIPSNAQTPTSKSTMVVAHRGASGYAPENTLAAAKLGWQQGAHAVEVDVHLSSDNKIVVIHDKNTKRTSGKDLPVRQTRYDQLKVLDVGLWKDEKYIGEQIPLLEDIVNAIPDGKKLVVEIKSEKKIVKVIEQKFRNHPKVNQLIFIAFDYETILEAKKSFPENKAFWLSSKFQSGVESILEKVKRDGLDGVDLNYRIIDMELMKIAREVGVEVHTWTVNDIGRAWELRRLGVESITTDYPDKILEVVK
ncbi:MAG: hypothetical protein MI975_08650 [Cytophagales bacterium]|nr:hypothetical protein [Cytophagales bacterium]